MHGGQCQWNRGLRSFEIAGRFTASVVIVQQYQQRRAVVAVVVIADLLLLLGTPRR
jgi:hypothetical protein